MRVMMMVKISKDHKAERGTVPTEAEMAPMGKYNEELQKAGVLLDLSGLKPSSAGARVTYNRGKPTVVDGPFTEGKELVGGYWILQVKSKEEAIEWAKRIPAESGGIEAVEIRPFYEMEDFAPGSAVDAAKKLGKKLPAGAGGKP
jgi:hypothetical protein